MSNICCSEEIFPQVLLFYKIKYQTKCKVSIIKVRPLNEIRRKSVSTVETANFFNFASQLCTVFSWITRLDSFTPQIIR